ncbi:hypothetical protein KZO83_07740 [Chromohalobacter sp. TMW 2.2308]|uniref:hypothetical protein n=1 Tax=Chromohalobacter TaxID=42054 RepID=UPI001FFD1A7C|nr:MULTISPECIES: hypothetical protein [Chromohalobacter]MCK2042579.1 hypothetical protein [Chromohalobacter moromii]MCT8514903.1 hypothetical protein [Chromohalobacter sp. TMW 2.2271]
MERFLQSIETALRHEDWYGALSTALTIPDICGKIEDPDTRGRSRYKKWYEQWVLPTYTVQYGADKAVKVLLTPEDCYGLRCSYLHEGGGELDEQAKHTLERFHFITPQKGALIHRNLIDNVLQLQVDIFCREIIEACRNWIHWLKKEHPEKIDNMKSLLVIHDTTDGLPFKFSDTEHG